MTCSYARLALALLAACWLAPAASANGRSVLVAEPVADPAVEVVARGAGLWLARQLDAVGFAGVRAESGATPDIESALRLANQKGAAYVVVPRLRVRDGEAEARWLLFPASKPELVTAPSARAPLAKVGNAVRPALLELLGALGVDPAAASAAPPTLDELASTGRALAHLDAGRLLRAWREVEGKLAPTAMALRESIVDLARRQGPNAAERARVLAAAGDERGAWKLLSGELGKPEPDQRVHLAAAEVQIARGNYRAALEHLDTLLSALPDDVEATLDLGHASAGAGRSEDARNAFVRAAELDPEDPRPLLELGALETEPEAKAQALLAAGRRTAGRLSPRRAERLLERSADLAPQLAKQSWRARAELAQHTGNSAEALSAWRQAAALDPEDADLVAGMGRAQRAVGDPAALASFERAVALDPDHAGALTELGLMQIEYGRAQQAVTSLERAAGVAPESLETRVALARALRTTQRTEDAQRVLAGATRPNVALLREQAALERETGDLDAARATLASASALDPWDPELLEESAALALAAGDPEAAARLTALSALLGGTDVEERRNVDVSGAMNLDELVLAFSSQVPRSAQRRVAHLGIREPFDTATLWQQWLLPVTPDMTMLSAALARALDMHFARNESGAPDVPAFARIVDGFYEFDAQHSLDAEAIAEVNTMLGVDAIFVTRLLRSADAVPAAAACFDRAGSFALESRMLLGEHADVVSVLTAVACVPEAMTTHGQWNLRALPAYALALLLLSFPMLRGWGSLRVEIERPPRTRGFLAIKVGTKPLDTAEEKRRQSKRESAWRRLRRAMSRYERRITGLETLFRWMPARSYYVAVSGKLYDAMGGDEIGFFLEEQKITVERGRLASLRFDFNPDEVAVLVSVTHGERPARGARVALRDDPNSLRYLRDENVYFYLREGEHIVCAGAGDRATEKLVRIESLAKALKVSFDLDDEDSLMIAGAEAAVEPYLLGDFESAARALDAAGEEQRAHLMRGAHYQQRGELERAASEYEAAGCIEEAAQLRASSAEPGASAQLFEQAGDYTRAAEAHRAQGAFDEAARCYEAAYDWDAALECWEAAGDLERVAELHEKQGSYLEAAKLAVDGGHFDRALENLQQIERRDSHYAESCRLTADVLAQRGEFDLAAERQAEAIALAGGDTAPAELHERHAELLAQTTDKQAALDAYQTVRRLDPRRSDVTQHIETLRSELTSAQPIAAGRSGPEAAAGSRYELIEEIGRGGMGVVYKARDTRLGRIVALKRLPHELRDNETAARLFLREARAAASLNHPNIVTVYDADEENGEYHITMELLEGLPINVIQERRNQINVPDAARIGIQVCAGLQYAHERRIVHRDIKTANLFFTRDKVVKIMDFGLAKTIEEVRKNSTVIGGTPYYMAPEQAAGGEIGPATDLYALGVTLHRLLTGTFPFTDGDLAYHHRHTPPPDPRQRRADLPEDVARLILDLLEKEPSRRPACATDVAQRLQALLQS